MELSLFMLPEALALHVTLKYTFGTGRCIGLRYYLGSGLTGKGRNSFDVFGEEGS